MNEPDKKKILVIRFSSLGDVVLTTAIFPNLKAHWPNSDVHVLIKSVFADVFSHNPHVDTVRIFNPDKQSFSDLVKEIRLQNYDIIIDLHGNFRSWFIRLMSGPPYAIAIKKHRSQRTFLLLLKKTAPVLDRSVRERILDCLKPLDIPLVSEETQLFPKNSDNVCQQFGLDLKQRLIGLAPGAQHKTKRWFPDRFAEAANRLGASPNTTIVFLGDKKDQDMIDQILPLIRVPYKNLVGWTSLSELFSVVSKLSLLLTNDSGLLHVGEALKVPLVALFGPTVRGFGFFPYRKTSRVVEVMNLNCRPCSLHGDEVCPLKHHKCMDDIDVNAVLLATSDVTGTL